MNNLEFIPAVCRDSPNLLLAFSTLIGLLLLGCGHLLHPVKNTTRPSLTKCVG